TSTRTTRPSRARACARSSARPCSATRSLGTASTSTSRPTWRSTRPTSTARWRRSCATAARPTATTRTRSTCATSPAPAGSRAAASWPRSSRCTAGSCRATSWYPARLCTHSVNNRCLAPVIHRPCRRRALSRGVIEGRSTTAPVAQHDHRRRAHPRLEAVRRARSRGRDEPAGRVDHPVPGQGAVAVGHHPPDGAGRLGLADPLGNAAVAGHRPRRDPPHHPLDPALEGRHRPDDPEADGEPLAVQSAAHPGDGIRAFPPRARTERHYTGGSVRLLLIAFYFPPAGGGGVQRTLKFCRDLPDLGVDVDVLAPSDPKWFALDEPLLEAIPARTTVHRARFLGPRSSFRGEALRGARGLRRAAVDARYAYERALVPDKAVPWGATAIPAALRIVRRRRIDAIMTTSPPPSVHLIGAAVAAATSKPWVADLRDSWLAHPHREYERRGVRAKRAVERRMARMVAHRATALVAVTDAIAAELAGLDAGAAAKTHVIGHGVDLSDFACLDHAPPDRFTIVHTG